MKLHIDIETYSSVDIKSSGAYKYIESLDFEILLVAYAFDNGPIKIVDLANGEKLPIAFTGALMSQEIEKHAHNAVFERQAFKQIGYDVPIKQWHCSAVKAAYCGLPLALAKVSAALDLQEKGKLSTGKALIRYFSCPVKPTKVNGGRVRNFPHHDPEKWEEYKRYCINDVEAEREIDNRLAAYPIPQFERDTYIIDQQINDRGVLVDTVMAQNATVLDQQNKSVLLDRMQEITGLGNPNSVAQLKTWLSDKMQKEITTLAKDSIQELIDEAGSDAVIEVLKLRLRISKSSVKKYTAMLNCAGDDNRARGLFQFYGAFRTGRWAGRLIQLQNLPQNHIDQLKEARELIRVGDYESVSMTYDVSDTLSQLIRTALVASPGKTFAVADFSAIEARVIAWFAGEQWRLDVFNTHGKIYEASAAKMFNVPIEKVTKGSDMRAKGKIAELALGYQGARGALTVMGGEKMGLSGQEMDAIVAGWRLANRKIVAFWKGVGDAAMQCVRTGKKVVTPFKDLTFTYDGTLLRIELPSGRHISYQSPSMTMNRFGQEAIQYKGTDQKTGQWGDLDTYGGKLVENIVQATARDLLAYSMHNLTAKGYEIAMHVHDENICEIDYDIAANGRLDDMCTIMGQTPSWAEGLPLEADGYLTPFYKKD